MQVVQGICGGITAAYTQAGNDFRAATWLNNENIHSVIMAQKQAPVM
jgi:hypothetical protein